VNSTVSDLFSSVHDGAGMTIGFLSETYGPALLFRGSRRYRNWLRLSRLMPASVPTMANALALGLHLSHE